MGSQQGRPSRSLEAGDDKLCHWKKKIPVAGVGCNWHHNLRASLKLHWSPWQSEGSENIKKITLSSRTCPFLYYMFTALGKMSVCSLFSFNIKMREAASQLPKCFLGPGCVTQPVTPFSTESMLYSAMGESCQTWRMGLDLHMRYADLQTECVFYAWLLEEDWLMTTWSWISHVCKLFEALATNTNAWDYCSKLTPEPDWDHDP